MTNSINPNDVAYWRDYPSEVSAKRVAEMLTEGYFVDVYTNETTGVSDYRIHADEKLLLITGKALEWLHDRVTLVDCTAEVGKPLVSCWTVTPIGGERQWVKFAGRLRIA